MQRKSQGTCSITRVVAFLQIQQHIYDLHMDICMFYSFRIQHKPTHLRFFAKSDKYVCRHKEKMLSIKVFFC